MKEYKNIRYSVKYFPNGKITVYELKNSITVGKEIEKEILKNDDEFISDLHVDLHSSLNENFLKENREFIQCKILDKKISMEDSLFSEKNLQDSINRTRSKVYDIVYCNEWTFFATFTFDKKYVDRYNYSEVSAKLRKFLINYKNRYDKNFKYLIIPEKHKDGAFHFHGFVYSEKLDDFVDSGHKTLKNVGDTVYNWVRYNFGWSNFTFVKSKEKCCNYILKYITKNLFTDNDFCRRKFSCSQNCVRPIKQTFEHFNLDDFVEVYENDFCKIFEYLQKSST